MPLSVLLGITNTGLYLPAAYWYISFESKESCLFMFAYMQEFMFYDECLGPYVSFGDSAAGLGAAMMKTLNQNEVPGGEAQIAWNMAQSMDESQTDWSQVDDQVSVLLSLSLVSRKMKNSNNFSVHPLVHSWARERLTPVKYQAVAAAGLQIIACVIKTKKVMNVNTDRHFIQHIRICSQLANKSLANNEYKYKFADEWHIFGSVLHRQGWYKEAKIMWQWALAGYEKASGLEHLDTISLVVNFAKLYFDRGKLDKAEEMWKRAPAGYEKALEPEHPDTLSVVQNLGLLYHSRGNLDKAEKMWDRALAGYEKVLEPEHPDTLKAIQNLGLLYHSRGNLDKAEEMWGRALAGYEKVLEPEHPSILTVFKTLEHYNSHRKLDKTEKMWGRALADTKSLGRLDEAEEMWKRALVGYEKTLEPEHPDTLRVVQNLGLIYPRRGKFDEAEEMWKRALAGYEKALEPEHPDTLRVFQNLGAFYHNSGKLDKAEAMWNRALAGYKTALEPEHLDTLRVTQNLGLLYFGRGQLDKAETMLKEALTGYEKVLGSEYPDKLRIVQKLGLVHDRGGNLDKAEVMWTAHQQDTKRYQSQI
ncbi:hypothetical protein MMC31_005229 [Peltigera leucophlebia]|nr:hypothetical protein [Peltigera leucophlebia]